MAPADAPIGRAGKRGETAMGSRGIYTPSSLFAVGREIIHLLFTVIISLRDALPR